MVEVINSHVDCQEHISTLSANKRARNVTPRDWLQVPAGLIDQGEDAAQAAVRELKEETGMS